MKNFWFITLGFLLLFSWALNIAPALNAPLFPELLLISFLLIFCTFSYSSKGSLSAAFKVFLSDRERKVWTYGLVCLVLLISIRAIYAIYTHPAWVPACGEFGGFIMQLECLGQAGAKQASAFRQFFTLLTALFAFGVVSVLSMRKYREVFPRAIVTVGLLFVTISLWGYVTGRSEVLPAYLFDSAHETYRATYLMQNPSWIWPYLMPSFLLIFISSVFEKKPLKKLLSVISTVLFVYFMLCTQQRGAVVFIICNLVVAFCYLAYGRGWFKNKKIITAIFSAVVLSVWGFSTRAFWEFLGIDMGVMANRSLVSGERLEMWNLVFSHMPSFWISGNGYGSWWSSFYDIANTGGILALDTAHNFFVQAAFELGLIHTVLIASFYILTFFMLFRRSNSSPEMRLLIILSVVSWTIIVMIQEVDFIRSTLYLHAIYFGWLCGAVNIEPREAEEHTGQKYSIGAFSLRAVAACLLGIAVYLALSFSLAGYQFEANQKTDYLPKVRWLRPKGTLNYLGVEAGQYAHFKIVKSFTTNYLIKTFGQAERAISIRGDGENNIAFQGANRFGMPHLFEADRYELADGRSATILVNWPPIVSQIPIVWAKGLHDWERLPEYDSAVRWCSSRCEIQFVPCSGSKNRKLLIQARRPDLEDALVLKFGANKSVHLSDDKQIVALDLPDDENAALSVSRAYRPENDSRELGVLIVGAECHE